MPKIAPMATPATAGDGEPLGQHNVYFRDRGRLESFPTVYYERSRLPVGSTLSGPAVVFQVDSTTVVPPGWSLRVDASGSLLLTHDQSVGRRADGNTHT
jgi:N-methylhydantoinase A/oxoprolinase/acetone carboxylase beta subunit